MKECEIKSSIGDVFKKMVTDIEPKYDIEIKQNSDITEIAIINNLLKKRINDIIGLVSLNNGWIYLGKPPTENHLGTMILEWTNVPVYSNEGRERIKDFFKAYTQILEDDEKNDAFYRWKDSIEYLDKEVESLNTNNKKIIDTITSEANKFIKNDLTHKLQEAKEIIKDLLSLKSFGLSSDEIKRRFEVRERAEKFVKEK